MKPIVLLDNGHGKETAGKRSPVWSDGSQLFEWEFNRDIVRRIAEKLQADGIPYRVLVPEENDVSLTERARRANEYAKEFNGKAYVLSIHANAGGGTGWEVYTSPGQTASDAIATVFFEEAGREFVPDGWRMRSDYSDGDPDKEANFAILTKTTCPAVLTENFFMDTEKDCRFIMSEDGRERIANMHVAAIKRVITL
jgi:N-acetylmuramoyl-L-alanine amidase